MKHIAVYDDNGKIIGRISVTDDLQALNYPNRVELDSEDSASLPELWAEVDVRKKSLRPKSGKVDPTTKRRTRD